MGEDFILYLMGTVNKHRASKIIKKKKNSLIYDYN